MNSNEEEDMISGPKRSAKALLRSLTHTLSNTPPSSLYKSEDATLPSQGSVAAPDGDYTFHYIVEQDVVFLVLCDRAYPRLLSFSFLQEIRKSFFVECASSVASGSVAHAIQSAVRPYTFIKFGKL